MRTVLITGGSRGIGAATAKRFQEAGYTVIAPTHSELDLSSRESIKHYLDSSKDTPFDSVINNAGINPINQLEDIGDEDLYQTMEINLVAPILLLRGMVGAMKKRGYGRIVNIGSIWGVVSKEKRAVYAVTKNGLHGLTNTLAIELGPFGILVNTLCPGYTNTELTKKNVSQTTADAIAQDIPLRRFAEPEEIAEMIYFLGSERNTYITGQRIVVDGGYTIK